MATTLSDGTTTVTLSRDMTWSDEHNWHPVAQTVQRGLTGSLIIQAAQMTKGRPITLEPIDDESGAMLRSIVAQLRNWTAVPGQQLTLTLRGIARTVIFRHQDGSGLESRPFIEWATEELDDSDYELCVLRLMEI